jgi:hypothetical protein
MSRDNEAKIDVTSEPMWTTGPLWSWRRNAYVRSKLWVYDTYCLVFLNRPGSYLKITQLANDKRTISPSELIDSLRHYHRVLKLNGAEMDWCKLMEWWVCPGYIRDQITAYEEQDEVPADKRYRYEYVEYLSHVPPLKSSESMKINNRLFYLSMKSYCMYAFICQTCLKLKNQ